MIRKIAQAFRKVPEFSGAKVLISAVSGGADSVAMLYCLHELRKVLGCRLVAVHLNHMTRGAESDADAVFVQELCKRLKVECVVKRVNVPALAVRKVISVEMAAREARYAFFLDAARKVRKAVVVTAHTKDDQAETMLLKLGRGAGLRGLSGIAAGSMLGGVPLLRPMLDISRSEVVSFLKRSGREWREDSSNESDAYLRNRVRHKILPVLERELNPDIKTVLARTADIVRQDDEFLDILAGEVLNECSVSAQELSLVRLKIKHKSVVRRVLIQWLSRAGVLAEDIDAGLIEAVERIAFGRIANAGMKVSGGFKLCREYDRLYLSSGCAEEMQNFRFVLPVPGEVRIPEAGVAVKSEAGGEVVRERGVPGEYPLRATVSRRAAGRRKIYVRSWREGDRIKPMGMSGSRKVKDVFIDLKVPAGMRRKIPLFECGGELIWVPGYRVARGWEVGPREQCILFTVDGVHDRSLREEL